MAEDVTNVAVSNGILYRKEINEHGDITGVRPFLLRTFSKLVFMASGQDLETALAAVKSTADTASSTVSSLSSDVQSLRQSVSNNNAALTNLGKKMRVFEDKDAYNAAVADDNDDLTGVVCFIKEPDDTPQVDAE